MADNYDRNRDNDRTGNGDRTPRGGRDGYRGDRNNDRGGYRGGSSDSRQGGQGSYGQRNSDGNRGGQSSDNRGGRTFDRRDRNDRDERGGYRGDRGDRTEDRRGGDRPYGRSGASGGYAGGRGGESGERRYAKRDERGRDNRGGRPGAPSRSHANRAGAGRDQERDTLNPQRAGFREERLNTRLNEPDLPADLDIKDLDPLVLQDLRVLSKDNADAVAKHMIMAATWLADDPKLALRHARAAKDRAGRISVVRETCGIAAYHAGEWKEALSELRAARRMSGGPGLIAVMADCERGLGRPAKAIDLARTEGLSDLDEDSQIELAIVVAGARHDLGQHDSAVIELQRVNPDKKSTGLTASRLSYAYADALVLAGRTDEAREWFQHVVTIDEDGLLDAEERLAQLDGGNN